MSDDPRKIRRTMERIFLCNDIWWDCLPWLSRAKVGLAFALVSDRFDRLADDHLESKKRPWTLGRLKIIKGKQNDATIVKDYYWTENEEHLPLPEAPLPKNVIGFKRIIICYVDQKVIDFLRRIRRLFQPKNNGDGIGLQLDIDTLEEPNVRSWDAFFHSIWPLIDPSVLTKLNFSANCFNEFRRRISPTFLFDLANVRVVDFCFGIRLGEEANGQLLRQWLLTPREDGKPKLLKTYSDLYLQTVEQLKTEFLGAQTAVSFIIAMHCFADYQHQQPVPFELDNWRTGERLAFRLYFDNDDGDSSWLLERGPIGGRVADQWTKWEREVMGMDMEEHNLLTMDFDDDNIGLLDETAGPSGQTIAEK